MRWGSPDPQGQAGESALPCVHLVLITPLTRLRINLQPNAASEQANWAPVALMWPVSQSQPAPGGLTSPHPHSGDDDLRPREAQ